LKKLILKEYNSASGAWDITPPTPLTLRGGTHIFLPLLKAPTVGEVRGGEEGL